MSKTALSEPGPKPEDILRGLSPSFGASALEQRVKELEAALLHRERQIDAMRRSGDTLFTTSSLDELVRQTLEIAIDVLDANAGSLLLYNPHDDTLVFRYVVGAAASTLTGFSMPATQGIAGRVFNTGQPDLTQKVAERAEFNKSVDEKTGYRTESMMTVPVKRAESKPIGVMQVLNAQELFDESDLEVLEVLSAVAAAAFENARLAQEARKAAIVSVIGDISHDIKNMLTPIQSGVWTLEPMLDELFDSLDDIRRECPSNSDFAERVEQAMLIARDDYKWILQGALDAAERVQARTREIADAVKGETATPHFDNASLNDIAHEVMRSLAIVAHDNRIDLTLDLEESLPLAQIDRKQFYNALYNLVNNAIPETPAGGTITIRTRTGKGVLSIEVQDTGKGVPDHIRKRLFTNDAVSTKPGGTGLGTRIVAGVVKRHNGTIEVESTPGQGSTFRITLPLRQNTNPLA